MIDEEVSLDAPDSLHADLTAAFDADEQVQTVEVEKASPLTEAARTLSAARKKPAEGTVEVSPAEAKVVDPLKPAEVKPDAAKIEEAIEAPSHWPQADRDMFAKQTPEGKTWLLARHKAMEADYTKKTQDAGSARRYKDQLDEVFAPYREAMARDGIDDVTAIKQLVAAHDYLQKDPINGINWLAQRYGIDLKQATEGVSGDAQNPELVSMKNRFAQLENKLNSTLSAQQNEQQKATLTQVEQFAVEKDAQGNALRPHFDEVAKDIAVLIGVSRQQGDQLSLQDAYDRAIYANPQVRAKVLAVLETERKAKDEDERKRKADAAKRAGFEVRGQGAAVSLAAQTNSVREDLEAAFAEHGARV